ncbi:MAG: hypothetical protein ASARMPREDX12_006283 [Alectoria sarmentosa]|nr:MAG: hypothetical protein ASARMPREDX12_006283 [Alectoria sarmentosa]
MMAAPLALDVPPTLTSPTNSSPIVLLSNASNPTPSTLENLIQSFSALTSISYDCDKESFGQPTLDSCMGAYAQLPAGSHARSYGDCKTQHIYGFPLPLRYVSADGTCIIEVFPTIQGISDLMEPLNLQHSVLYLIQKCVAGENPEGGIAEKLAIAQCVIDVMIDGPLVRANWYDIWGSAVMNVAMCARFGKSGVSFGRAGETELAVRVANDAVATFPGSAAQARW